MLGPSVKSRIVRMLPKIATDSAADELNRMLPDIPTRGMFPPALSCIGDSVVVEFSTLTAREPLTPFCGAKNATTPEFPAGHATYIPN
jgi:hypothetical protein